jgi:microcystin-dependent protein
MSTPYVGEIRMFGGTFAPVGWMLCQGQILPISEYETLFNLIGTMYGGDGQETFGLPNLASRIPMHMGNGVQMGEVGGVESVTLTTQQIPQHNHLFMCNTAASSTAVPTNNVLAQPTGAGVSIYFPAQGAQTLAANTMTPVGGSQPHDNMQPFQVINFIISLYGVYPSQT